MPPLFTVSGLPPRINPDAPEFTTRELILRPAVRDRPAFVRVLKKRSSVPIIVPVGL
jgi:hypothetical protein